MREPLRSVAETDVSLVLVLDGRAWGPLTRHLLSRVGAEPDGPLRADRSPSGPDGHLGTAVEVAWGGGSLLVVLRLAGATRPRSDVWYGREVAARRARGVAAWAVLVGATHHADRSAGGTTDPFDAVVTFEQLLAVAGSHDDPLSRGACSVLGAAVAADSSRSGAPTPVARDRARNLALLRPAVAHVRSSRVSGNGPVRRADDRRSLVERRSNTDRRRDPARGAGDRRTDGGDRRDERGRRLYDQSREGREEREEPPLRSASAHAPAGGGAPGSAARPTAMPAATSATSGDEVPHSPRS